MMTPKQQQWAERFLGRSLAGAAPSSPSSVTKQQTLQHGRDPQPAPTASGSAGNPAQASSGAAKKIVVVNHSGSQLDLIMRSIHPTAQFSGGVAATLRNGQSETFDFDAAAQAHPDCEVTIVYDFVSLFRSHRITFEWASGSTPQATFDEPKQDDLDVKISDGGGAVTFEVVPLKQPQSDSGPARASKQPELQPAEASDERSSQASSGATKKITILNLSGRELHLSAKKLLPTVQFKSEPAGLIISGMSDSFEIEPVDPANSDGGGTLEYDFYWFVSTFKVTFEWASGSKPQATFDSAMDSLDIHAAESGDAIVFEIVPATKAAPESHQQGASKQTTLTETAGSRPYRAR